VNITIAIEPMGAVRMTQRGKFTSLSAQRYLNYKKLIAWEAKRHVTTPIEGAVTVKLGFVYPIPESWTKKKKALALNNELLPKVKPDIDNVIKGVFDALNGIVWKDDNLVVQVEAYKRYGHKALIDIEVQEATA
jgi:Holliday junction resolvase RusA-like endonuclease